MKNFLLLITLLTLAGISYAHPSLDTVAVDRFTLPSSDGQPVSGGYISFKLPASLAVPPKVLKSLNVNQYALVLCLLGFNQYDMPVAASSYGSDWEGRDISITYYADEATLKQIANKIRKRLESIELTSWKWRPNICKSAYIIP